ncbi:hypothetical protein [Microbacterium kunmingense]
MSHQGRVRSANSHRDVRAPRWGREMEAEDMAALEAQVPEGWQLLGVLKR